MYRCVELIDLHVPLGCGGKNEPAASSPAKNIIGDLLYFPARVFDSIKVLSGRIKLLVIYSPTYGEDPAKLIKNREQ